MKEFVVLLSFVWILGAISAISILFGLNGICLFLFGVSGILAISILNFKSPTIKKEE